MNGKYGPSEIDGFAAAFERDGFVILPGHFPTATLRRWAEAFAPLLTAFIAGQSEEANRGAQRHYVTLPFAAPFADPAIIADADVLAIVETVAGADPVMCQLATDTPLRGSDYQDIHRDTPPLFPELEAETPSYQLAVNFPLIDVTPEHGPVEIARGTHRLPRAEGVAMIAAGAVQLEPFPMRLGDLMIRDVRGLHRGTPNRTDEPRPMVVIGYSRKWLYRPEVSITVPRPAIAELPERVRRLLRFNPVVESLADVPKGETYNSFLF